jgi:quinohemoprotein ethanol dehydrogenase
MRMTVFALLATLASVVHAAGYGDRAINDENDGRNWLAYGRTYSENHASPLKQITAENIDRLGLAWSLDLPNVHNGLTVPLAVDGVIYFTVDQSKVHAVDAKSGKLLWRFDPEVWKVAGDKYRLSWGPRGIAYWKDKIYVGTLDGRLIALAAKSGKQLWSVQTVPKNDSANITGAPRVFNGKVIIGHGGADFGQIRGYVTTYDAETGKQLWRWWAVPGDPAKGFEDESMAIAAKTWTGEWWKLGGGGTAWNALTYDPELNRVYIGTGNGQPHAWKPRSPQGGDNLFLSSIVALDADTGKYIWHYQNDPGNDWDYNSTMDITTATLNIDGKPRKVLMQAPKNGFLYVIDRESGKLLSGEKIDHVTWAERIDLATGRPVENPDARANKVEIWPSATGAHSVMAWAFSPQTGYLYIPTISSGNGVRGPQMQAVNFDSRDTTRLQAWDPVAKKAVWSTKTPGFWNGGVAVTAGNVVFHGLGDGHLKAYDARDGKELWSFNAHFGIAGAPITYQVDGKQYVSIVAGWGGTGAAASGQMTAAYGWQSRVHMHRLLTFVLDGKAVLPPQAPPQIAKALDAPEFVVDSDKARLGAGVWMRSMCLGCHGFIMIAGGMAPDLRASPIPLNKDAFRTIVRDGAMQQVGMPRYDKLTDEELDGLQHYIRQRARETLSNAPRPVSPDLPLMR